MILRVWKIAASRKPCGDNNLSRKRTEQSAKLRNSTAPPECFLFSSKEQNPPFRQRELLRVPDAKWTPAGHPSPISLVTERLKIQ